MGKSTLLICFCIFAFWCFQNHHSFQCRDANFEKMSLFRLENQHFWVVLYFCSFLCFQHVFVIKRFQSEVFIRLGKQRAQKKPIFAHCLFCLCFLFGSFLFSILCFSGLLYESPRRKPGWRFTAGFTYCSPVIGRLQAPAKIGTFWRVFCFVDVLIVVSNSVTFKLFFIC